MRHGLLLFAGMLAAGCNDSNLLGASGGCDSSAPQSASTAQAATAPDAVPADANALVAAMDVPVAVSGVELVAVPLQAAAFQGLGTIAPTKGPSFAYLASGVAGAGSAKSLDVWATTTQNAEAVSGGQPCTHFVDGFTNDCAELTFSFVAPDGAEAMAFDFNFLSTEYPEFVGSNFNDSFRVSVTSPSHSFPNVVYDGNGEPIDVNNVFFIEPCGQLTGTGYDIYKQLAPTECDAGATSMLTTYSPVEPGETVTVTFMIYDLSDAWLDSGVAIDNFRFDAEPITTPHTETPTPTPAATATPDAPDPCE